MTYIAGVKKSVDTGDTYFNEISKETIAGRSHAIKFTDRERFKNLPINDNLPNVNLNARVEHARWIVDCPNCNSSEFAFEDKLFLCSECRNSDINGNVRKVNMPSPEDRKDIEDILSKRPIKNRHWKSGETIDSLKIENLKAGVKL